MSSRFEWEVREAINWLESKGFEVTNISVKLSMEGRHYMIFSPSEEKKINMILKEREQNEPPSTVER